MWKCCLVLVLAVTSAWADEHPTAYQALRVVGTQLNRDLINRVISVTGVDGVPQPETWKILIEDPGANGGIREIEVANGRITSDRTAGRKVVGSVEGAVIKTTHLNLDSNGAYAVASSTADKSHAQFGTVNYTLRTDEHGDPIWIVTLFQRSGRPVGTIYIGANKGTVTRTEGMFSGMTMQDVETDAGPDTAQDDENSNGIIGNAKARVRATFRHAQDEARDTFQRMRHSFAEFIDHG